MFDLYTGNSRCHPAGELLAYLCGANGQNCTTHTMGELAVWFRGMAYYASKVRA
jgi:hypothetical protein